MEKKKKKFPVGWVILSVFAIAILTVFLCKDKILTYVGKKAAKAAVVKVLDEKISADDSIDGISASDIINNMSEQDQNKVDEIIEEHVNEDTIQEVESYITSGDMSGLKDYVKGNVTSEDKATLTELYNKYKDQVPTK